MRKEQIELFLAEARVAVLGINRRNGSPQLVPIWYTFEDGVIWISSGNNQPKVRNIEVDSRVTLCIDDRKFPYKQVAIYGKAILIHDNVQNLRRSIAQRYLGESAGLDYIARSKTEDRVLIKLIPERFYSWDESLN